MYFLTSPLHLFLGQLFLAVLLSLPMPKTFTDLGLTGLLAGPSHDSISRPKLHGRPQNAILSHTTLDDYSGVVFEVSSWRKKGLLHTHTSPMHSRALTVHFAQSGELLQNPYSKADGLLKAGDGCSRQWRRWKHGKGSPCLQWVC